MRSIKFSSLSLVFLLCLGSTGFAGGPLPQPEGQVILSISGVIGVTNAGDSADFDRAMLNEIGMRRLDTYTDWTEGVQQFAGVPLADLLSRIDAKGTMLTAVALNDYRVEIPVSDAQEFDVFLALDNFGKPMPIREKGPVWIIYPSDEPGSDAPKPNNEKMVWQLRKLIVK